MARAIWSGAVGFGLVNIPVKLYSAIERKDVHFNQFEHGSGRRIHNKRVAEGSGKEVKFEDIDKGYEVTKGRFVMVTPEELESVEPGRTKTIEIEDFVDLHEVDPIYFDTTYYLAPAGGADKPYLLLLEGLRRTERIAIARFVMRTKQYLAALRPGSELIVLETMLFPDEIRDASEVEGLPSNQKLEPKELQMATNLIESLTTNWDPKRYTDTYRGRVLELIRRKAKGQEIVIEREEPTGADVLDLMAALEASVKAAREGTRPAEAEAPSSGAADGDGHGDDFAGMSKKELDQEARKRGIPGRSTMTREQLAEALGRAS
jgi:DNA end-binding protein Ku